MVSEDNIKERDYQFARDAVVQSIVRNIRFNRSEIKKLEEILEKMLWESGYHLESLPGVDIVTACSLIDNIGNINRFSSADKLASFAGVAPKNNSSAGKGNDEQNKSQGKRELYNTLFFLANQQIYKSSKGEPRNPALRAYFGYKTTHGKTKVQGLLCIMRRLVSIIYSMMKNKSEYHMPEVRNWDVS